MGRLIDADVLKNIIESEKNDNDEMCRICIESTKEIIDTQPTAYDLDNVVEQLKSVSYERYGNDDGMGGERVINMDDAIEIVKGGGENA